MVIHAFTLDYGGSFSPLPEVTYYSAYLRLCWVFVAAQAVSSCGEQGLLPRCGGRGRLAGCRVWAHCSGLWLQSWALGRSSCSSWVSACSGGTGSTAVARGSVGTQSCGSSGPGVKPVALVTGQAWILTTEPPQKPGSVFKIRVGEYYGNWDLMYCW